VAAAVAAAEAPWRMLIQTAARVVTAVRVVAAVVAAAQVAIPASAEQAVRAGVDM
jgi:hypothetical protein